MMLIIFAILCSIASYGLFLVLNIVTVLPFSGTVGGLIALAVFILVLVFGRSQKNKIKIKTLLIPTIAIAVMVGIMIVSRLTDPANMLPEELRQVAARCVAARCKVVDVQKTKFLIKDDQFTNSSENDAWCIVLMVTNQEGNTKTVAGVGYYNRNFDQWVIQNRWYEQDFVEHGCTNYPK